MAEINFYLRNKKTTKETPIRLFLQIDGERHILATRQKVKPIHWSESKQRVKQSGENSEDINDELDKLTDKAKSIYKFLRKNGEKMSPERIKELFYSGDEIKVSEVEFMEFFKQFIKRRGSTHTPSTIKSYQNVYNRLVKFESDTNYRLTFNSINMEFYRKFETWSYEVEHHSKNTFGNSVKIIKTVMSESLDREIHNNQRFQKQSFKKTTEESDNIYLNLEELKMIQELDLSQFPSLDNARDVFLLGCYTGLRFGDLANLKPEDFNTKKSFIEITTSKTGEKVIIPIHPVVSSILAKWNNTLPKVISNQKLNDYIKEVGKKAGLNEIFTAHITKAGKRVSRAAPKYEFITTHTARRSFATNSYLAGVPTLAIMKITGHRTEQAFLKYIKVSQEENAKLLLEHPFFK